MTVIPVQSQLIVEDSDIWLARYARLIEYPECSFFGVRFDGDADQGECRDIWSKTQRDTIAKYLSEAQFEIEEEIGYFLSPRYVVGTLGAQPDLDDRYVDSQNWNRAGRFNTRWPKIIASGIKAESNIEIDSLVDNSADPAVIGPVATSVTDIGEIHIFHPGSDVEIIASKITISGGQVTIEIPRCRLVTDAAADNAPTGIDYNDIGCGSSSFGPPLPTGSFECTVDVKRIYTDTSTNAQIVWTHSCSSLCASNGCTDKTQNACIYIRDSRRGEIDVRPARFSGGEWLGGSMSCPSGCGRGSQPQLVRLNYLAGTTTLSRQAEDAILRLAHSKMPTEPCGCAVVQRMWQRDRDIPTVLDRERLNCPFGLSAGSWVSWKFAQNMKEYRGSTL